MITLARASAVSALTCACLGHAPLYALDLLPTVPITHAYVSATVARAGETRLADPPSSFYVYDTSDSRFDASSVYGGEVWLGGPGTRNATLDQWDGTPTTMGAYASATFGMNRVAVSMDANQAPPFYRAYGSIAPSAPYIESYIYDFDYGDFQLLYDDNNDRYVYAENIHQPNIGYATPTASYVQRWVDAFDYFSASYIEDLNNARAIYAPAWAGYAFDATSNDLVFYDSGVVVPDPYGGSDYFFVPDAPTVEFGVPGVVAPSPWSGDENYFVPNQPEVEIDLVAERYVRAYARWEDVFYFGAPGGGAGTGVATLTLMIDGTLAGDGWNGQFSFYARDWDSKDSWGDFLAYLSLAANEAPQGISQLIEIEVPFEFGTPQYVKAEADAYLWGEGDIDFANTVRLVSIEVPEEVAVYSYATYLFDAPAAYAVLGGIDGSAASGGYGGFFGGGGGGEVPLPPAVATLLAPLAMLARRRIERRAR